MTLKDYRKLKAVLDTKYEIGTHEYKITGTRTRSEFEGKKSDGYRLELTPIKKEGNAIFLVISLCNKIHAAVGNVAMYATATRGVLKFVFI